MTFATDTRPRPIRPQLGQTEFIALIAMLFATIAFSIDSMLPALPQIAAELTPDNINAAQLFKAATAVPEISAATAKADYAPLLAWLRESIHRHGGALDPTALMEQATGKPPSNEAYLQHLKSRYL
jgi:hypothetical protein